MQTAIDQKYKNPSSYCNVKYIAKNFSNIKIIHHVLSKRVGIYLCLHFMDLKKTIFHENAYSFDKFQTGNAYITRLCILIRIL